MFEEQVRRLEQRAREQLSAVTREQLHTAVRAILINEERDDYNGVHDELLAALRERVPGLELDGPPGL